MKIKIFAYLFAFFLVLAVVPLINIFIAVDRDLIRLTDRSFLYNTDFVSRMTARLLYPFGISTDPKQVIVGKDGWLYLGDMYQHTISDDRREAGKSDVLVGRKIGDAANSWSNYLSSKGVKVFKVMIGPNKGSIYPEYMPSWAMPTSYNPTDALLEGAGRARFVDLRTALIAAKEKYDIPLYYKTDTHWNDLGAGIAFKAFAQEVGKLAPELKWPSDNFYELSKTVPRRGGDLANFLRLTASLDDYSPSIGPSQSLETIQIDFDTGNVVRQGGNPEVTASNKPILVKTAGALNNKKVLWLRDSFGKAMSPIMATTFNEVLQIHWGEAMGAEGRLSQLVETWKPDYVFVTVVERAARDVSFTAFPPMEFLAKDKSFQNTQTGSLLRTNQLLSGLHKGEYKVGGGDAFLDFELSNPSGRNLPKYLNIDLTCEDGAPSVPVQLFWIDENKTDYDEENSARFSFRTGQSLIDLHTIPNWPIDSNVKRVRIDVDAENSCKLFKLDSLNLGRKV